MRICNAFTDAKQKDVELKNKTFRYFRVRLTRYEDIPQTEYIYKSEVIDMRSIEARLHNAMLQNEDWEQEGEQEGKELRALEKESGGPLK